MVKYFTEENSVDAFISRMTDDVDPRFRQIMDTLIRHVHAFVTEVKLTPDEWEKGIDFLTKAGQTCSEERQEFILLSDVLGVSMLVDTINSRRPPGATGVPCGPAVCGARAHAGSLASAIRDPAV